MKLKLDYDARILSDFVLKRSMNLLYKIMINPSKD